MVDSKTDLISFYYIGENQWTFVGWVQRLRQDAFVEWMCLPKPLRTAFVGQAKSVSSSNLELLVQSASLLEEADALFRNSQQDPSILPLPASIAVIDLPNEDWNSQANETLRRLVSLLRAFANAYPLLGGERCIAGSKNCAPLIVVRLSEKLGSASDFIFASEVDFVINPRIDFDSICVKASQLAVRYQPAMHPWLPRASPFTDATS